MLWNNHCNHSKFGSNTSLSLFLQSHSNTLSWNNLQTTLNNESFLAIELRVVKGCDLSANFGGDQGSRGTLEPHRNCWHSPISDFGLKLYSKVSMKQFLKFLQRSKILNQSI